MKIENVQTGAVRQLKLGVQAPARLASLCRQVVMAYASQRVSRQQCVSVGVPAVLAGFAKRQAHP